MVPLNKATLAFPFGAVDQAKGTRHLLAGELTEATNLRMVKEDEWRKRPAFDRTVSSFQAGQSHSGTPKEFAVVAGSDMWRDGAGQVWSRDSDSNVAYLRGASKRVFPTHFAVNKPNTTSGAPSSVRKPLIVLAGGDIWVFSQGVSPTSPYVDYNYYGWEILDATTLVRKGGFYASAFSISSWAAAYDSVNGKIWLLLVGSNPGAIDCRAFDATVYNGGAPAATTYRTVAGKVFNTVDIRKLANGEFLVAASSFVAGTPHDCYFEHSYLNTATGVAKTSPAPVATTTSPSGSGPRCCTGIRTLNYDGANGTAYYALWRTTSATNVELVLIELNTTSLAITATVQLVSQAVSQLVAPIVGVCCGYRNPVGSRVVFAQLDVNDATVRPRDLEITRYVYNGASVVVSAAARGAILLSDPFNQGTDATDYYFVTGYDDGQTAKAQRTYFLRSSDGVIVSQFLPGEAAAAWHNAAGRDTGSNLHLHNTGFVNLAVNPASGKWMIPVAMEDTANESSTTAVVELDFTETYAPPTVVGDVAIWNGPIPQVAGPRDQLHDLAPLLFPSSAPTFGLGSGAALGTFQVAYRYRFQDADGDLYRSAPSPSAAAAFATTTRTVTMQLLNHISQGMAFIELYGSVAGGTDMYLQAVFQMWQASTTLQVAVFPERWTAAGELLDTIGGALSPSPPPPCRCSALWRNRVHLSGCAYPKEIWSSKEMQPGRGPEFNEVLVTEWSDGSGAPKLLQAADWNYLSVHKSDAIGVLSGSGPDGRGAGGYIVSTLAGQKAGRPGSAVTGPMGCYFQNVQDGRICLLPPGAPAIDIGRGVESHRATSVVAALHVESERQIWFFLANAKILVLHYAFPTASSPYGRWSVYSGAGMVNAAVGAGILGTTARYLESSATVVFRRQSASWQDDNGTYADVLTKLKFDRLRPAGHQGEFMLDVVQFEGQHVGASALRITLTNDAGQTETFPKAATASPLDYRVTAGAQTLRTKEVGVTIEETASATEGFVYDSLAVEVKTTGKIKTPNAANWIAPG